MIIDKANQPKEGYPKFTDPVFATVDCHVFVHTSDGDVAGAKKFYCDRIFAVCVLKELEKWCIKYGFSFIHIGCYNPRNARKRNGEDIIPIRWSNHSYGLAIDFKGIKDNNGKAIYYPELKTAAPKKFLELIAGIKKAIQDHGRYSEIVDDGQWLHIGIWVKNK